MQLNVNLFKLNYKSSILSFFVPPCSHSIKYIPFWNEVVARYKDSGTLKIACVNCYQEQNMCDDLNVVR